MGAQGGGVARHIGRTAQARVAPFNAHHRYRGFRRNPADVAKPVAVEHDVAHDEDAHGGKLGRGNGGETVGGKEAADHLQFMTLSSSGRRGG